ncbi:uncharacterized protein G2W53_045046 [Senna tora]|uniref:Uncharacterized protein n=1 Tax=Senna tora TaxID=362788 RepID=A0A834W190_9FABA|nr:uncharacterized protein G2W53_045046 [Senna tora]
MDACGLNQWWHLRPALLREMRKKEIENIKKE